MVSELNKPISRLVKLVDWRISRLVETLDYFRGVVAADILTDIDSGSENKFWMNFNSKWTVFISINSRSVMLQTGELMDWSFLTETFDLKF